MISYALVAITTTSTNEQFIMKKKESVKLKESTENAKPRPKCAIIRFFDIDLLYSNRQLRARAIELV